MGVILFTVDNNEGERDFRMVTFILFLGMIIIGSYNSPPLVRIHDS
jgi:hypothetical protein